MENKLVLITGATSGIGEEIAKILYKNNYDLILVGRNKEKLKILKEKFSKNNTTTFEFDLSKYDSAKKLFEKLSFKKLSPDIVINNAGFGIYDEVKNYDYDNLSQMISLNITTLTNICSLSVNQMISNNKKGTIVNVASTASFQPIPYLSAYGASKSYVLYFSHALQQEVNKYGISISSLCPGPTKTQFEKRASKNKKSFFKGKVMTSQDVAKICYEKSILKQKSTVICGFQNKIGAIFGTLTPKSFSAKIAAKLFK